MMIGLISRNQVPIPLKSIDVSVNISGTVAEVDTGLSYYNEEDTPVEATFTFPVDDGSAVYKFEADIDGRKIVAEIQEKEQAELTYKDAVEEGKTAALMKQDEKCADIFQCMLGNLPPQKEARLTLSYVIELPQDADGQLTFTLPTILNPRYSPEAGNSVTASGATYVPPSKVPYQFSMTAKVKGYHKVESVTSKKCSLKVEMKENNHVAMVTLADEFKFDHDLSLQVKYEDSFTPQVVMEMGNSETEGMFKEDLLMLSFRPELKEVAIAESGEYVFVIDRSGSMNGDRIQNAKEALLLFLKSLPAECYFNVFSFGSSYKALFSSGSKKYTEESLQDALKLQEKMAADMGGTEILKPLEHIYKQQAIKGHDRFLFLLTDGQVRNTDQVIRLVKKNAGTIRVFTLGVGAGVSTALVSGIARAGNGKAEFIDDDCRVQPKVVSLLKCAMQPACTNVEISWDLPPEVTPIMIPVTPPSLIVAGERLTLFAIMQGVDFNTIYGSSSVTLKGQTAGKPVSYELTFTLNDDIKNTSLTAPAHRLAAKTQIKILEDEEAAATKDALDNFNETKDMAGIRNKIISLSRYGNLISKWTAFVAVDLEGGKVEGTMVERPCPIPAVTKEFLKSYKEQNLKMSLCDYGLVGSCGMSAGPMLMSNSLSPAMRSKKKSSPRKKKGGAGFMNLFSCVGKSGKRKKAQSRSRSSRPSEPQETVALNVDMDDCLDEEEQSSTIEKMQSKPQETLDLMGEDESSNKDDIAEPMDVSLVLDKTEDISDDTALMEVIRAQQLKGNWKLDESIAKWLQMSLAQIQAAVPLKDDGIACTVAVVVWMQKFYMTRKEEWQIIETKAVAWLETQTLESNSVQDLMETCRQNLWPVS